MKKWYFKNKKTISLLVVIMWASVIFIMSLFNSEISSMQSGRIVSFIADLFNIENIDLLSLIVRKLAHFTEFFILGYLVCNMCKVYDTNILFGFVFCILYAFCDEIHQLFISGRHFAIFDVVIDSLGVFFGNIFYMIGLRLLKRR